MDVTQGQLEREIGEMVQRSILNNEPVQATWLTHAIVNRHCEISGDDTGWYRLCAYGHVRETVRRAVRKFQPGEPERNEDLFKEGVPGFKKVQPAYSVKRDGEYYIVPIQLLTFDEFTQKAEEMNRMIGGLQDHRDQILRYRDEVAFPGGQALA